MTASADTQPLAATAPSATRSCVIGSGFGGLFGTKALRRADVDVTMIAKTTHHLFQPLLYQVATGILSEGEIAPSTREILSRQNNARVLLGEVTDIDLEARTVTSARARPRDRDAVRLPDRGRRRRPVLLRQRPLRRVRPGHEEHRRRPRAARPDLRRLRAGRARRHAAARTSTTCSPSSSSAPARPASRWPARSPSSPHRTLKRDFRAINTRNARVVLVDAAPPGAAAVRRQARRQDQGASSRSSASRCMLGAMVTDVDERGIEVDVQGRPHRADRGRHQDLGRRRPGQPARQDARRADRRAARPRRPDRRQPRPHAARATPRSSWSAT